MKFTPEVVAALQTLKDAAENDFERHRINILERDLTAPPKVEIVDDTHQKFNGIVYYKSTTSDHYQICSSVHRAVYAYYFGEIPTGYGIHHKDFNPANNSLENLQLVSQQEHKKIHNLAKKTSPTEATCKYCGKAFLATNYKHLFCSPQCSANWYYHNKKIVRHCEVCGKEFYVRKSAKTKCCSTSCASKKSAQSKPLIEKSCVVCGKSFETKNEKRIYCSHACAQKAFKKRQKET